MSWLATKYAWKCRHEDVKGSVRLVLLAIALRVRKNFISTSPTSMTALQRLTFLSDDQVRRCLEVLVSVGEVRRLKRGKYATYALVKMAGPLFVCDVSENPQDAVFLESHKTPQDAGISNRKMRGNYAVPAGDVLSSNRTSTNKLTPTTSEENAAVEAFWEWFLVAYQERRGVLYRPANAAKAKQAIAALLATYGASKLQAMALAMWNDRADPWLNDRAHPNDRGIFSLRHKATYLEGLVVATERAASEIPYLERIGYCRHTPRCEKPGGSDCRAKDAAETREAVG